MPSLRSSYGILLVLLSATSLVHAHSWIEQLMVIAPNGTFVGEPGYPRGNVKRSEPGFGDPKMVYLVGDNPAAPMCKDSQQSPSSQSASSPPLKAAAGADVALRFQENGHVTLPEGQLGKAENRGDIFVYGTTQPKDNELFNNVHGVWTADGKGGDGRGVLLAKASYDDGQCYQVNGGAISTDRQKQFAHEANQLMGADLWCQTDVRLPSQVDGQLYTLYWVWDWATAAGVDPGLPKGKNETYTTCMDIALDSAASEFSQKVASTGFVEGQPVDNAAVPAQFAKLGEQAAAPAPAQSGSASASSAPGTSGSAPTAPAAAPPAAAPPVAAPPASNSSSPSAPALGVPTSASSVPLLVPPGSAPTVSPGSIPTAISPIAGPDATAAAGSAPGASAGSIETKISPIPGGDAPSATAPAASPVNPKVSSVTVSETVTVMTTVNGPASATAASFVPPAPRIRGRNQVFRWGF